MGNWGIRPSAVPWLRYETLEAIAQGAELVTGDDGQLLPRTPPLSGASRDSTPAPSGLASRVRTLLAQRPARDGVPVPSTPNADPADVLEALRALYGKLEGPEKDLLPRSLLSRNPQAAAQEMLQNLQSARARLLVPQLLSDAARQSLERQPPGSAESAPGPQTLETLVNEAARFARVRWPDRVLTAELATVAVQEARRILAQRGLSANGAQAVAG